MELITDKDEKIIALFSKMNQAIILLDELLMNYKPIFNGERYLTDSQLSEKLHISRRTLQDYRTRGIIPYIHLGGKILYRESDIETLLQNAFYKAWNIQ